MTKQRERWRCVGLLLIGCISCQLMAGEEPPAAEQLDRLWRSVRRTGDLDHCILRLESFAKRHAKSPQIAALAYLRVLECLNRKRDFDSAIAKAKWLAAAYPSAEAPQAYPFGYGIAPMVREWREYVRLHPILIKHYAWYRVAQLCERAKRFDEALAAYDRILSSVPQDPLPETKNPAIVTTFRLHQDSLNSKIAVLRRLRRLKEAKQAKQQREKLYPAEDWRRLGAAAHQATASYEEAWEKETEQKRAAMMKVAQEHEERARQKREAEARARAEKLAEPKAKDDAEDHEERRRRYEKWKRRREAQKAGEKKPEQGTPQPAPPADKAKGESGEPESHLLIPIMALASRVAAL